MEHRRSPLEDEWDRRVRAAARAWLDERRDAGDIWVSRAELLSFQFEGTRLPLVDPNRGIRKPKSLTAALSILTTYTPPWRRAPYEDIPGSDGRLRYKYRGTDPEQADNVALRRALERRLPLIWFYGIAEGLYLPCYPVWLVADEPNQLQFVVATDEAQLFDLDIVRLDTTQRRYSEHLTRQRLHQPVFRAQVLHAYETTCAMCRLRHAELLDAAHILRDIHPRGIPAVTNGLSLCKIHHAAYDKDILGIRPDLVIEVRRDILEEIDGPMLRHGIQEMKGIPLTVPKITRLRPDPVAIEERYAEFLAAR